MVLCRLMIVLHVCHCLLRTDLRRHSQAHVCAPQQGVEISISSRYYCFCRCSVRVRSSRKKYAPACTLSFPSSFVALKHRHLWCWCGVVVPRRWWRWSESRGHFHSTHADGSQRLCRPSDHPLPLSVGGSTGQLLLLEELLLFVVDRNRYGSIYFISMT